MAILKVYNGSSWDEPVLNFYDGSSFIIPEAKFWDGGAWVVFSSGDVVALAAVDASELTDGAPDADIFVYNTSHASLDAEVWADINGVLTKQYDLIQPDANIDLYQLKWEALSGDAPTDVTTADGVWHAMSTSHWKVGWETTAGNAVFGTVTVSIRKGTGSVIDTALWSGDADGTDEP